MARAVCGGCRAMSVGSARGYPEALEKLATLQSNRSTTLLFGGSGSGEQLNARAIPEMKAWLRRAGYGPADLARMRHIHVAGTKGKGSVCAFATAMLMRRRDGGSVGTYTSPHLVTPRERIAIDGQPIGQQAFADAFFELWDRFGAAARREDGADAAQAEGPDSKPFFFRLLTIMAWHVFLARGVADVVFECGIGGEYDATNVLPPAAVSACVVTQLGIDHVAMLGDSPEQIAWHKAGIMKPGVKCFTGLSDQAGQQHAATQVLRARAEEKGARLVGVDDETVRQWGGEPGLLAGDFQKKNQALAALAVLEHLAPDEAPSEEPPSLLAALRGIPEHLALGLRSARLRGRCEVLERADVSWLLDGAHTPESLAEVARWLAQALRPPAAAAAAESVVLVFNQQDRDAAPLLAALVAAVQRETRRRHVFRHALFTRNDHARHAAGAVVDMAVQEATAAAMAELVPGCDTACLDNVEDAVARARALAARLGHGRGVKPKVLVTGSLHLVGAFLRVLEPDVPL